MTEIITKVGANCGIIFIVELDGLGGRKVLKGQDGTALFKILRIDDG